MLWGAGHRGKAGRTQESNGMDVHYKAVPAVGPKEYAPDCSLVMLLKCVCIEAMLVFAVFGTAKKYRANGKPCPQHQGALEAE